MKEQSIPRALAAAVCGICVAVSASPDAQTSNKAMAVFLTAAQVTDVSKIDKDTQKRLEQAIRDADKKRKDLEKALKAQHGNKRDQWPQEAQDRYLDAEEEVALATADLAYRKVKQEGLTDSVQDIKEALRGDGLAGKKENVRLVDSAADAQLIAEVIGRRSGSGGQAGGLLALRDDKYWVLLAIKAGPKLAPERFAAVPLTYRFGRLASTGWRLARPRPESPEWRFEAYGDLRWANAAHVASLIIEDFITKNYDAMTKGAATN
jgi:hypothetical protein